MDITASQKKRIANNLEQTNNCTTFPDGGEYDEAICVISRSQLADGGVWYPPERVTPKYLAKNFFVSAGAFVLTFALVMVVPSPASHSCSRRFRVYIARKPGVREILATGEGSLCPEFDDSSVRRAENLCAASAVFPFSGARSQVEARVIVLAFGMHLD